MMPDLWALVAPPLAVPAVERGLVSPKSMWNSCASPSRLTPILASASERVYPRLQAFQSHAFRYVVTPGITSIAKNLYSRNYEINCLESVKLLVQISLKIIFIWVIGFWCFFPRSNIHNCACFAHQYVSKHTWLCGKSYCTVLSYH